MVTKKSTAKPADAVEIQALDAYRQSRIKTEMWLGSRDPHTQTILSYGSGNVAPKEMTWVPALFTAYREIVDNALDEMVTHGNGDRLEVTYNPNTMQFKVSDNGRGIPITIHPERKIPQATLALSEPFSGRNFNDETRGASRGTNGVGAAMVNFCSEWFKIDICRDKKNFHQTFSESEKSLKIEEPLVLPCSPKSPTGTTISWKLSKKVFKNFTLPEEFIRDRVFEIALAYPKLKVFYNGKQVKTQGLEKTLFAGKKPIVFEIKDKAFTSRFWLLPEFLSEGEHSHGMVNAIPVFNGGSHIDAFKRLFYAGMAKALERTSKQKKLNPNRSDFAEGMLIYNITEMDAPAFDSQSKTRLINENVAKIVTAAMDDPDFFKGVVRRNPEWIESVYERCRERTQKKDDKEIAAQAKRNRGKVEKLVDATGMNRMNCVLLLAEGDSALSGSMSMRDPKIHGGLPLRGKVMNTHPSKTTMKEAIKSEALQHIMMSIGLVPGQRANRFKLRYGKVYITCDADEDGKNITALLVNFFYQWWPELFEDQKNPFLHVFETPLIIARKGKTVKFWYNDDYDKFSGDAHKGWDVTRAKGLAALHKPDWKILLNEPKLTPITDDGQLKDSLDLLFNEKRADDRKEWIGK